MRALLVLALLASVAHADDDDEPVDSYDPVIELRRSFRMRDGQGCYDHLAVLRARGVPDTTKIAINGWRPDLRAGTYSLAYVKIVCARRMLEHVRRDAETLISNAIISPRGGADACVERWPLMIASGVVPTERVTIAVWRRGRWVNLAGTLEQLYVKHCENAYTPRRRGE